jgi:hypothetical protein
MENERVKCSYDSSLKLYLVEWTNKTINLEQYQEPYLFLLDYNEKNKCGIQSIIVDIRAQKVMPPAFRKWFEEVAIRRALAQGLKRAIAVSDTNVFKKYYINNILDTGKRFGLPLKIMATVEEAMTWVKSLG